ncbi:PHP domain-containing protein [Kribbia dieselivorans]|uniref:PHP domain-containing protein n=1 Tax=Kribbia dieselivorans TaxID=331526 RepID=UPI000838EE7E|nr:PHP domain-containing protein [Kribbia dieselivorans]
MGHSHDHGHGHGHHHHADVTPATDLSISDSDLHPADLGRRNFLRAAGVLGAGAATTALVTNAGVATAAADEDRREKSKNRPNKGYQWLAGDHHIHTQYSSDAMYRVDDQVKNASALGLDWMVITDHGSATHAKLGVDLVNPDIRRARADHPEMLVFQGLEWNIPAAEHGTVFVHPGSNEVDVLKQFENTYDGTVTGAGHNAAGEALAVSGLQFLKSQVNAGTVDDALMFANHPARQGIDSPHEVRAWRDAADGVAMGWEGAPGHQAAGISKAQNGPGSARGYYGNAPRADRSFPGYPLEAYRTWGGFDFYTSTVGGLWDSLLAEGKPWWITANSDSHSVYLDPAVRGANSNFNLNGKYNDPEYGGTPNQNAGDFWPGYYSRTNVGTRKDSYAAVMAGLRDGNVWVDHGHLIDSIDVQVRAKGDNVGLGGVIVAKRGTQVELVVTIVPAQHANWAQFQPQLKKVDLIKGRITGPVADKDTLRAPETKVVKTWEVSGTGEITLTFDLGRIDETGFYIRLRGSDGNRTAVGYYGADADATGPAIDVVGDADPWRDLWFYTNPVFVLPKK